MQDLRGAFDQETNQVIGIQMNHAGRRTSAASRSSYTSLRYC
jgi:2,4-dienoyl-CoA reductase-like NADH-dependent reductase (Old Yellow Enzyme family)